MATICSIILILTVNNYFHNNKINVISKNIEFDIKECKIENDVDTHGGFLGDGEYFAKIKCPTVKNAQIIKKWRKYPMSEELQKVLEIKLCNSDGCEDVYDRYNIPKLEVGYYYFLDRHSDAKDKYDDKSINRSSYNFSLGIYDFANETIYFYELDT